MPVPNPIETTGVYTIEFTLSDSDSDVDRSTITANHVQLVDPNDARHNMSLAATPNADAPSISISANIDLAGIASRPAGQWKSVLVANVADTEGNAIGVETTLETFNVNIP